jgi:hypothetical protein
MFYGKTNGDLWKQLRSPKGSVEHSLGKSGVDNMYDCTNEHCRDNNK